MGTNKLPDFRRQGSIQRNFGRRGRLLASAFSKLLVVEFWIRFDSTSRQRSSQLVPNFQLEDILDVIGSNLPPSSPWNAVSHPAGLLLYTTVAHPAASGSSWTSAGERVAFDPLRSMMAGRRLLRALCSGPCALQPQLLTHSAQVSDHVDSLIFLLIICLVAPQLLHESTHANSSL